MTTSRADFFWRHRAWQPNSGETLLAKIRTVLSALMVIVALGFGASAYAEMKVAVVDVESAIMASEEAKRLRAQIREEFKSDQERVRDILSEGAALIERAQKDAEVMSDAEKRKLQQQIDGKNNDLVYHRQKLQKALEDRQAELFEGLLNEKVQRAIEALVLDEDYDIVIPRQAALYVGDLYDVTRKVTERLNEMDES